MNSIKLVSFLLPTRKRFDWLVDSINSIITNAKNKDNYDILLAMDNDDLETIIKVENFINENSLNNMVKLFKFDRKGYHNLHIYINELSTISNSLYLCLWNDDAKITTINWDEILETSIKNQDQLYVYQMKNDHYPNIFPIVPKKWVDILGHFSLNAHNDSWIEDLALKLNVNKDIDIFAFHYRTDGTVTYMYNEVDESISISSPDFSTEKCKMEREIDLIKLRELYN